MLASDKIENEREGPREVKEDEQDILRAQEELSALRAETAAEVSFSFA